MTKFVAVIIGAWSRRSNVLPYHRVTTRRPLFKEVGEFLPCLQREIERIVNKCSFSKSNFNHEAHNMVI